MKAKQRPTERKPQQFQIDDLLDEISHEVDLESKLPNNVSELDRRLAELKGEKSNFYRNIIVHGGSIIFDFVCYLYPWFYPRINLLQCNEMFYMCKTN